MDMTLGNVSPEYVRHLEETVYNLSDKLGIPRPARSALYERDDSWVAMLEDTRIRLLQLQREYILQGHLERYVQRLESELLRLSASYNVVDALCDVPMNSVRTRDEAYVAALEEAVATLERKVSLASRSSSSEQW